MLSTRYVNIQSIFYPLMSWDGLPPKPLYLLPTIGEGGDDFYPAIHKGVQETCCLAGKSAYSRLSVACQEAQQRHGYLKRLWKKTSPVSAESLI